MKIPDYKIYQNMDQIKSSKKKWTNLIFLKWILMELSICMTWICFSSIR